MAFKMKYSPHKKTGEGFPYKSKPLRKEETRYIAPQNTSGPVEYVSNTAKHLASKVKGKVKKLFADKKYRNPAFAKEDKPRFLHPRQQQRMRERGIDMSKWDSVTGLFKGKSKS
jgi:hypothetical protein